jgi:hypothetical protein
MGYATTSGAVNNSELVDNAVETAVFGAAAKFKLPGKSTYPEVDVYDSAVAAVSIKDMVSLGETMISAITKHTPGIICEGGVSKGKYFIQDH